MLRHNGSLNLAVAMDVLCLDVCVEEQVALGVPVAFWLTCSFTLWCDD